MNKEDRMFDFNLQLFADDGEVKEVEEAEKAEEVEEIAAEETEEKEEIKEKKEEKTFTQSEVERMVKDRVKREKREAEKAVEEAKKLAKMNEEQKKQYKLEKLEEELEEYRKKEAYYELSKEASKMLLEEGINADDHLLEVLVKDDAEGTQETVNSFINLFNEKVKEGVKKALTGNSPRKSSKGTKLTKDQIMKIEDANERIKAIRENPELFKK